MYSYIYVYVFKENKSMILYLQKICLDRDSV